MTDAGVKLLRWLLFGVLVSTLPIVWAAASLFIHGKTIVTQELLGNGDLLMASCACCAVALGELIGSDKAAREWKIAFGFFALLTVAGSCLIFSSITDIRPDVALYQRSLGRFEFLSILLFAFGTIFGGAAVWVSEG